MYHWFCYRQRKSMMPSIHGDIRILLSFYLEGADTPLSSRKLVEINHEDLAPTPKLFLQWIGHQFKKKEPSTYKKIGIEKPFITKLVVNEDLIDIRDLEAQHLTLFRDNDRVEVFMMNPNKAGTQWQKIYDTRLKSNVNLD